jgi:hypothetical protein
VHCTDESFKPIVFHWCSEVPNIHQIANDHFALRRQNTRRAVFTALCVSPSTQGKGTVGDRVLVGCKMSASGHRAVNTRVRERAAPQCIARNGQNSLIIVIPLK